MLGSESIQPVEQTGISTSTARHGHPLVTVCHVAKTMHLNPLVSPSLDSLGPTKLHSSSRTIMRQNLGQGGLYCGKQGKKKVARAIRFRHLPVPGQRGKEFRNHLGGRFLPCATSTLL